MRYLVLGDVTLAIETNDGLRIITDNRVNATASKEREAADAPEDSGLLRPIQLLSARL